MRNTVWAAVIAAGALGAVTASGASCGTPFQSTGGSGGGTGGDASGSTSSSGSTSTSSSSSGSSGGESDCFDGIDNDNDGKIDCADPDCDPVAVCIPDPGSAWEGPNAGTIAAPGTEIPCPGGWPDKVSTAPAGVLKFDPATCGCSCGQVQDACNGKASLVPFPQGCGTPAGQTVLAPAGQCQPIANLAVIAAAATMGPAPDPNAGCNPMGSVSTNPVSSSLEATFCGPTKPPVQGGCDTGMVCAPKASAPYKICFASSTADACPEGFVQETVVYGNVDDSRDCTDCQCSDPQGLSCGGKIDLFSDQGCTIPSGTAGVPMQCMNNPGITVASVKYSPMTNGSCNHLPVTPTGTVTSTPYRVCCQ